MPNDKKVVVTQSWNWLKGFGMTASEQPKLEVIDVAGNVRDDDEEGSKLYWTVTQAAAATGLSTNWFYQRTRVNALPGLVWFGRHARIEIAVFRKAVRDGKVQN